PDVGLPSAGISLPEPLAAALRAGTPPVVGRVEAGRCVLDLRTVAPDEDGRLLEAVAACM
ncbi:L-seryl-tRNA(Sec) selenium transferase, partial [Mycolicibacterium litorale]